MKNHTIKPKSINISSINSKECILSPSRYKYVKIENKNILSIDKIFNESKQSINIEKNKGYYNYIEIGSINNNIGTIESKIEKSIHISTKSVSKIIFNDILISTVRTYLGGIGIMNKNIQNAVASKALIVLRNIKVPKDRFYLFGLLRSSFFIEQVSIILNASMYPRMERDYFKDLYIPFPTLKNHKSPELIEKYVSLLTQNIIDKEEQIEIRQKNIDELVYTELRNNQKSNFSFSLPKKSDLLSHKRIDTGLYTEKYKEENHLIENYKNGFSSINTSKFKSGSTPKTRIFNASKSFLKWVTPTNISDEGFYNPLEKISMPTSNNLKKDCILFINRTSKGKKGEYVGITCFYDVSYYGEGQHNQGLYRIEHLSKEEMIFTTAFMNSRIMRKICGNISIGSKMKEMKSYDFATLKFPKFDKSLKKKIGKLYYNNIDRTNFDFETYLDNEKKRNQELGIFQLNTEIIEIKKELEIILNKIITEEQITI